MAEEKIVLNDDLKELKSSGYEMAEGDPNIRGWKVRTDNDLAVGKVSELLFDIRYSKVRYLVVDVDGKPLNLLSRDVLVPIGLAELDENNKLVMVPDLTVGHLASLPEYKKGEVSFHTEREIRGTFLPDDPDRMNNLRDRLDTDEDREKFYSNELYSDRKFYGRRQSDGEFDTDAEDLDSQRKKVDLDDDGVDDRTNLRDRTRDLNNDGIDDRSEVRNRKRDSGDEEVGDRSEIRNRTRDLDKDGIDYENEVRNKKVDTDDNIADDGTDVRNRTRDPGNDESVAVEDQSKERERSGTVQNGGFAPFQEGVIEIKEHKEVPVVNKEARVVEEITVEKDVDERSERVSDSVRQTKVDIEKMRKSDLDD